MDGKNKQRMSKEEKQKLFSKYQQIDSYGVIGNMRTCAHVCGKNGSIDWFCYPHFNSPSVFCRLLDHDKGGFFQVNAISHESSHTHSSDEESDDGNGEADGDYEKHGAPDVKQSYWPDTNILITKFCSKHGIGQVIDFMPVVHHSSGGGGSNGGSGSSSGGGGGCDHRDPEQYPQLASELCRQNRNVRDTMGSASLMNTVPLLESTTSTGGSSSEKNKDSNAYQWICRRIEVIQGSMTFRVSCFPAFNYARDDHRVYLMDHGRKVVFHTEKLSMTLVSSAARFHISSVMPSSSTSSASGDDDDDDGETGGWLRVTKNFGAIVEFELDENANVSLVFRESTPEEIEEATAHFGKHSDGETVQSSSGIDNDHDIQFVGEDEESCPMAARMDWLFIQTMNYWHRWLSKCNYQGRWREHIYRSALILKLMTFEPTGAIVAAPTTSLPEGIGGNRNWDYRYTWVRDSAYVVYSFIRVGFYEEAENFIQFILERCKESIDEKWLRCTSEDEYANGREVSPTPPLKSIYSINGQPNELEEFELDHLEGYKGSKPVRIGNAASDQLQLDVYGELLDAIYLYNKYSKPVSYDFWRYIVYIVNWVCENYDRKDDGVWEVRGGAQHFLYSKVLCWVCIDRGLRLADKRSLPCPRVYWQKKRDALMVQIMRQGYNEELQSFTQAYGSKNLDASALIMPLVLFMAPTDPRMLSTLKAINRSPKKGGLVQNSLVYRYDYSVTEDGFRHVQEGTFNMCTFWLIECLARTGDKQKILEARLKMEQFFTYRSSVGLFSEEMSWDGHQLGNYPQGFTHLALISSVFNLNRALDNWRVRPGSQS